MAPRTEIRVYYKTTDSANLPDRRQIGAQNGAYRFGPGTLGVAGPRPTDRIGGQLAVGLPDDNLAPMFFGDSAQGDRVTATGSALDIPERGPFSIEMLFKPNLAGAYQFQELAAKGDCCANNSWYLLYWGPGQSVAPVGTIRFGVNAAGPPDAVDSTVTIPDDEYTHIAVTYDPVSRRGSLYLNGELDKSERFPTTVPQSSGDPFVIGGLMGAATNFTRGIIDEVSYYARALSEEEVLDHFNALFEEFVQDFIRQPGDANEDGSFDSADIVNVLASGKYETDEPATWSEGDWNAAPDTGLFTGPPPGDGQFNSLDIIAALAAGKFETGPYIASAGGLSAEDIPEPQSIAILVLGVFMLATRGVRGSRAR